MAKKMMNPNTTIWWFDEADLPNPAAPAVGDFTAAKNISCAIVTGYTLNATDSDTDDSKSICDEGNVATPTWDNYEANITFFRDADSSDATSVYNIAFDLFKAKGATGYLVRRLGKKNTEPVAAGDIVSVFKVISDNPQDVDGGDTGPIQFTIPFLAQGEMHLNVPVVATTP